MTENKSYYNMVGYRDKYRKELDAIKDGFKTGTPFHRHRFTCPCGKVITLHNCIIHYCGKKHRKICGDIVPSSASLNEAEGAEGV
jgi:hypothetical protein